MTAAARPKRFDVGTGPAVIRATARMLNERALPEVYVHAGSVVHIEQVSGAGAAALGDEDSPLPVVASDVDHNMLAKLLAVHTFTYRKRSGKDAEGQAVTFDEEVTPSVQQLRAALAGQHWPGLDPLDKIAGAPLLRPDGTLLQDPGYDKATGIYLASKVKLDRVPEKPSRSQVEAALRFLLDELLPDFPWVAEADRANYLAVIATPILRWYLRSLIPFVVFTATMPSSGKTILTSGPGMLYGQRVLTWPVDDDTELRKVITSVLADPVGAVIFDNLAEGTVIKSPVLARLLTDPDWADRLLGGNATANYANDRLWCATGNNLRLGGDMPSRTVMIRLDPDTPRPEERKGFKIDGLDQWILQPANQCKVLWNLLVLILDWIRHGAPRETVVPMRQFTPWCEGLGGFLAHHGVKGFLANADSTRSMDSDDAMWGAFLARWHALHGGEWWTAAELRASADIPAGGLDPWDGLFPFRPRGKLLEAIAIGKRLEGQENRWRDSYVLRVSQDRHLKVKRYRVEERAG
jgi:hypothetical protein